jgi:predicted RNA-binding protein YlqC (UPF0109 family)
VSDPGSADQGSTGEGAVIEEAGRVATLPVDAGRAGAVLAYLAANLVDDPDRVTIESQPGRNGGTRLSLRVAPEDMGRVIGRRGRIAQSIRGVVRAAGAGEGLDVTVDIVD